MKQNLVDLARDSGDLDEAIWRSFLAAHFGRSSTNLAIENQIDSAFLLPCGFGANPMWTWKKVCSHPTDFRNWLYDHADDLETLSFGNLRKYDSKRPDTMWEVIEPSVEVANEHGGPTARFTVACKNDLGGPADEPLAPGTGISGSLCAQTYDPKTRYESPWQIGADEAALDREPHGRPHVSQEDPPNEQD